MSRVRLRHQNHDGDQLAERFRPERRSGITSARRTYGAHPDAVFPLERPGTRLLSVRRSKYSLISSARRNILACCLGHQLLADAPRGTNVQAAFGLRQQPSGSRIS